MMCAALAGGYGVVSGEQQVLLGACAALSGLMAKAVFGGAQRPAVGGAAMQNGLLPLHRGESVACGTAAKFAPSAVARARHHAPLRAESEMAEPVPMPEEPPAPPAYDVRNEAGVLAPTGFFDPLGLSDVPLGRTPSMEARIKYFREAELKHGRVAMLAALGFLVGEQFHPLFGGNIDVPSYIAFQQTPLQVFWPAVVAVIGAIETTAVSKYQSPADAFWSLKDDAVAGDFGFDPLGLKPKTDADFLNMQNKELANGRLAMFGIAGMVGQELARHEKLFGAATDMGTTMAMPDSGKVSDLAAEMANVLNSTQ